MKLEAQVVSLELAKKLKSLNVKQESLFYWFAHREMETHKLIEWRILQSPAGSDESCSAFTVAELGEMLPDHLHLREVRADFLLIKQKPESWIIGYSDYEREGTPPICETTEADARAKCLIYLLENKLI